MQGGSEFDYFINYFTTSTASLTRQPTVFYVLICPTRCQFLLVQNRYEKIFFNYRP